MDEYRTVTKYTDSKTDLCARICSPFYPSFSGLKVTFSGVFRGLGVRTGKNSL